MTAERQVEAIQWSIPLRAFARAASRAGVRWYLYGSAALLCYGVQRSPRDLDIAMSLDGCSLWRLLTLLEDEGFSAARLTPHFWLLDLAGGWRIELYLRSTPAPWQRPFFHRLRDRRLDGMVAPADLIAFTTWLTSGPDDAKLAGVRELRAMMKMSQASSPA